MKICPQCKRTYSDDSLRFCLDDGSVLARDPTATISFGSTTEDSEARTQVLHAPSRQSRPVATAPVTVNSSSPILTAGVVLIAGLLLVLTVIGAAFIYKYWTTSDSVAVPASSPTPTPQQAVADADPATTPAGARLQIKSSASSVRYAVQSNTYDPLNTLDNNKRTAWIEGVDGAGVGEWLRYDFGRELNLHRIVILPGYFKSSEIWVQNNRLAAVTLQFSDGSSKHFSFPNRMERQTMDVGAVKTRWVRLVIDEVFSGTDPDTAVSEVAFEWEP
jgi:hypothetical protein